MPQIEFWGSKANKRAGWNNLPAQDNLGGHQERHIYVHVDVYTHVCIRRLSYTCVYINACICVQVCTRVHVYIHVCTRVYRMHCVDTHVYMHTRTYVYICVHAYICMHACSHLCVMLAISRVERRKKKGKNLHANFIIYLRGIASCT